MRKLLYIVCAMALSLLACSPDVNEDAAFCAIDAGGWVYGDTLYFEPELSDSVADALVAVSVRHNSGYIFSNLWLEITAPPADGDSVPEVDTVNIVLADAYGKWLGHGSGVSRVVLDTLPRRYVVRRGSPLAIRHIMRVDTVENLEQIGVVFINDTAQ